MLLYSFFARFNSSSIYYFYFAVLLISVCDFVYFFKTEQYSFGIYGALACTGLHLLPVFLFTKNIRLYLLLLSPIFIFIPFNLGSIILFGVPFNDATFLLILNTNIKEAKELLGGYLFNMVVVVVSYVIALIFIFNRVPNVMPLRTGYLTSFISLIVVLTLPIFDTGTKNYFANLRSRFYTIFPTSLLYASKMTYSQYKLVNSTKEERTNFRFNAKQIVNIEGKQVYVLVIGESSRYDHWGINGYEKKTSPMLSKRENLISFNNVASGGFITEYALPLILTGVGADNFDKHYRQKSIVSVFKEAGFSTYWLTNQVDEGHIKVHIQEADKQYLSISDFRATKHIHRDMELVETLKKILSEPGDKKFIVLHTIGSHYDYSVRYPDEFDKLKPSNKTVFSKSADKKFKNVLVNSYDNSILYTDTVIDTVISLVSSQNAHSSVTYLSDHGENLFDDGRDLSQHAYPVPSKYIAQIPYFVWYSPLLEKTFPDKISNLKSHINAKISSENIIHTFTSMSGIQYLKQDSTKNVASSYFKDNQQRILGANRKVYNSADLK
ncbi:phosphoethanolamine transferase [Emticicia sp. W12TSBA100-4]|uniref:phosphoethanolamine transferase n=1 Tax=Emticicia sp. W12TSBA100-4 TaxID=3160965 RepID=UPI0033064171